MNQLPILSMISNLKTQIISKTIGPSSKKMLFEQTVRGILFPKVTRNKLADIIIVTEYLITFFQPSIPEAEYLPVLEFH